MPPVCRQVIYVLKLYSLGCVRSLYSLTVEGKLEDIEIYTLSPRGDGAFFIFRP